MCAEHHRSKALIFDLDGTLVDTVYAHVFAWQGALIEAGMPLEGLQSGGYGEDELLAAGAYRVYRDTAELHKSLDELGI